MLNRDPCNRTAAALRTAARLRARIAGMPGSVDKILAYEFCDLVKRWYTLNCD